MNHTRLWAAAVIITFVIIVGFVLSVPHTRDIARTEDVDTEEPGVSPVTLRDSFKKGVHTITGSLTAPNACAAASAQATFVSEASSTDNILLDISLSEDSEVCLQLPTLLDFSATVAAPANVPITVTVNGSVATTSIQ